MLRKIINHFGNFGTCILILLTIITSFNIFKSIEKNKAVKDLIPAIYKSTQVIDRENSEFEKNIIPLKIATLSDGRIAKAYELPQFDLTSGNEPNELSLHGFSDSSILYSKNTGLINGFYHGDIILYDVKSKESKNILNFSDLQNYSNFDYYMSEKYVVIKLDNDFYIYDRATSTGKIYTLSEITAEENFNQLSSKLQNNTLYLLTSDRLATYNIETNEFKNMYTLPKSTENDKILGISDEYIILERYLLDSQFNTTFTFINQNNGEMYSFENLESISVSSILNYEDKIVLQSQDIDTSNIVFDKTTCDISSVLSDNHYNNLLTSSINDFAISTTDFYEYSTNYNSKTYLVDLKNSQTHPINFDISQGYYSFPTAYVHGNSLIFAFTPSDHSNFKTFESYLIIID
ncbi:MAG: hypothetical protein ACRDCW_00635 [Sarcina sp.]